MKSTYVHSTALFANSFQPLNTTRARTKFCFGLKMSLTGRQPRRSKAIIAGMPDSAFSHWKPSSRDLMIMITLSGLSLMVSLDASIIVTSLSVRMSRLWSWGRLTDK